MILFIESSSPINFRYYKIKFNLCCFFLAPIILPIQNHNNHLLHFLKPPKFENNIIVRINQAKLDYKLRIISRQTVKTDLQRSRSRSSTVNNNSRKATNSFNLTRSDICCHLSACGRTKIVVG